MPKVAFSREWVQGTSRTTSLMQIERVAGFPSVARGVSGCGGGLNPPQGRISGFRQTNRGYMTRYFNTTQIYRPQQHLWTCVDRAAPEHQTRPHMKKESVDLRPQRTDITTVFGSLSPSLFVHLQSVERALGLVPVCPSTLGRGLGRPSMETGSC